MLILVRALCHLFNNARTKISILEAYLSSSIVKEMAQYGGDISKFVPAQVVDLVYEKYHIKNK